MSIINIREEKEKREWFKNHEKDSYSIKDIKNYAYSRYRGLKESITEDNEFSLEQQMRRVMRKKFNLKKIDGKYSYKLNEDEVIYLVNNLMRDYFSSIIYPDKAQIYLDDKIEALRSFRRVLKVFNKAPDVANKIDDILKVYDEGIEK